jgi:hypothetical protein
MGYRSNRDYSSKTATGCVKKLVRVDMVREMLGSFTLWFFYYKTNNQNTIEYNNVLFTSVKQYIFEDVLNMDDFKPHIVVINLGTNLVSKRFGISRGTPDTVSINFNTKVNNHLTFKLARYIFFNLFYRKKSHERQKKSNIARSFQ